MANIFHEQNKSFSTILKIHFKISHFKSLLEPNSLTDMKRYFLQLNVRNLAMCKLWSDLNFACSTCCQRLQLFSFNCSLLFHSIYSCWTYFKNSIYSFVLKMDSKVSPLNFVLTCNVSALCFQYLSVLCILSWIGFQRILWKTKYAEITNHVKFNIPYLTPSLMVLSLYYKSGIIFMRIWYYATLYV